MEPKIRFKGFEGEWKNPTINEIFEIRNGYTPSKSIKEFWEGGTIPWFRMEDIRENGGILKDSFQHITPLGIKSTGLFEKNSIILATTATIGVHAILIADSLANQQFTNFSIRKSLKNDYNNMFVYYSFFGIDEWSKKNTNSGGLLSVNVPFLLKEHFHTPSLDEQKAIAEYFQHLDSLIQSTTKKIESLKQVKAASLQSMFPQEGEAKPRIRFKGFSGEWITVSIGECGKWSKGQLLSKEDITPKGQSKCIHYGELFTLYGEVIDVIQSRTDIKQSSISQIGDILFPDSDVTPTGLARCSALMENGVVLGGGINILRPYHNICSPFLSYAINMEKEQIISRVTGTTVRHINSKALSEVIVKLPKDIKEQTAIANYFQNLDKQISFQTQRLEKLKQIKSACLDNMFV